MTLPALADLLALAFFALAWALYAHHAAGRHGDRPSLLHATHHHRREWMLRMLERDNRIVDSALIGNLMRSVSFFASTTMIVIGGVLAMLGATDRLIELSADLPFVAPASRELWELKVLLLGAIFVYAFFKFTWSLRQFNYSSILMGAAPAAGDLHDAAQKFRYADRLAHLNSMAGDQFNRGLRAYYFGLAVLTWFIHPWLFMLMTAATVVVLYRREFSSSTLHALAVDGHNEA